MTTGQTSSAHRQQEDAERYRAILEAFDGLVYVSAADHRIEFANQRLIERTGHNPVGEFCYKALHDRDSICPWCIHDRVFAGETVRWEGQSPKDGRWNAIVSTPVRKADGTVVKLSMITDITERKEAEDALKASEAKFRYLFEHSLDATFLALPDGTNTAANPAACAMFGRSAEELCRIGRAGIVDPTDPRLAKAVAERDRTGVVRAEVTFVRKDGTKFPAEVHSVIVAGENSQAVVTLRDVSARKAAEEALRRSEEQFRLIIEAIPDLVWAARPDGFSDFYSDRFLSYLGKTLEEMQGWTWATSVHPEDAPRAVAAWTQAYQNGSPYEAEFRLRRASDGQYRWHIIRGFPLRDQAGQILRWFGTCTDIEEGKQTELLLHRRAQEFRTLVENAPDIIERFDRQLRLAYVNPILGKITGIPTAAFIGKTKREIGMPQALCELWEARLTEVFATGRETSFEFDYLAPRGLMHLYARVVPETAPDGSVESALSIVRDITAQKQAEDALQKAKEEAERASRAKDHFLAVLSHELRTPLAPVLTAAQMMQHDPTLSPEQQNALQMIGRNVELEARLIDDLLDLTRITRGKLELHCTSVDLHQRLEHVLAMCRDEMRAKELVVTIEAKADRHRVWADPARLQQILWNLLKNAVKFTPVGGAIRIGTQDADGERVSLTVQDTGVGIEPETIARLFNAFEQGGREVTRRFGGLGLGLAISKGLVDLHGGTLSAQSPGRGHGATFTLVLPTASPAHDQLPLDGHGRMLQSLAPDCRVLLVEDHPDTARVMRSLLASYGFEVTLATSFAAALQAAGAQDFDLLISDIGLPDGSGLDLPRQMAKPLKAIAISGFGMEADLRLSKEAGFLSHLTKPVDIQAFERVLGEVLARPAL